MHACVQSFRRQSKITLDWLVLDDKNRLQDKREEIRQSKGIHTEGYKSLNEEVSWLTVDVKQGIWQCKVFESNGTSQMWFVLKSLTDNKPNGSTRIITDDGRTILGNKAWRLV